ncbi:hypothetical protein VE23_16500 [Paenibacillus sp. D9]|nr:hypothetical protein VE23_16500 [Paenibacillus sp. D9]
MLRSSPEARSSRQSAQSSASCSEASASSTACSAGRMRSFWPDSSQTAEAPILTGADLRARPGTSKGSARRIFSIAAASPHASVCLR